MAFDGIVTKAIAEELKTLIGYKIDKVYQPTKNTILLGLYGNYNKLALNICIDSSFYRMHLTTHQKPNPAVAPNFCMLLRKHLIGSKIKNIVTYDLERVVILELEPFGDSYNVNKPNEMFLNQTFRNKSVCQSIMTFSDEGIEISKVFKIIPNARNFKATNQFVSGSIVRNNDFYSANVKLQITGDDFGNLITQNDILKVRSIKEIIIPINYFGGLKSDLNLLCVVNEEERKNSRYGSICALIGDYIYAEEEQEMFEEGYEKSKEIIEHSNFLEFAGDTLRIGLPMIHAPYSFEILKNIKGYVHKQENNPHLK